MAFRGYDRMKLLLSSVVRVSSLRATVVSMAVVRQTLGWTWRSCAVHRLISAEFCALEEILGEALGVGPEVELVQGIGSMWG